MRQETLPAFPASGYNAADQGRIAGRSMCGIKDEYTDTYAMKNTINFFGLVTLCVGKIRPEEGDVIHIREDRNQYKRAIVKDGKVEGSCSRVILPMQAFGST